MSTRTYESLTEWKSDAKGRGYRIVAKAGIGEDPYTHYFAYGWLGAERGYFGDANGADADYGELTV